MRPALSFIALTFFGIVIGQNRSNQTNSTTEVFISEETTRFEDVKNETTQGYVETDSTTRTTYPTTEAKPVTFTQVMSTEPKVRLRPLTTVETTNPTVTANGQNETFRTTEGMLNVSRKSHESSMTTATETMPSTQTTKQAESTRADSVKTFNLPTEIKPETTPTPTTVQEETSPTTVSQKPEINTSHSTEVRKDIKEDPIEKELDEAINSMPKLPELEISDNETHFKFHQDPEEASIDERITQIARQLAETGLRREYEERKLGHFIPISVMPIEYSTMGGLPKGKSFEFGKSDVPHFRPSHFISTLLKVLTKTKAVTETVDDSTYETITNLPEILQRNKSEKQIKEINGLINTRGKEFERNAGKASVLPNHPHTLFQLLSAKRLLETKPESRLTGTTAKDLTTRGRRFTEDTTYYSFTETTHNS